MYSNFRSLLRPVAALVVLSLLLEIIAPTVTWALTDGPTQPEFTSFEPVGTSGMVNEFTGAFTYNLPVLNIPGPNGSGYALSLSYHSGSSPEDEASWVGYGWTLNPGSIVRAKRGIPDDFSGESIRYWNKVEPNWTVTVGAQGKFQFFSENITGEGDNLDTSLAGTGVSLNGSVTVRYNNYKGFGSSIGLGLSVKGVADLGFSVSDGEGFFSYSVNPVALLSELAAQDIMNKNEAEGTNAEGRLNDQQAKTTWDKIGALAKRMGNVYARQAVGNINRGFNAYVSNSFGDATMPTNITQYEGESYNFSVGVQGDIGPIQSGYNAKLNGSYSRQENVAVASKPSYGLMYLDSAETDTKGAVMDYYTEKDAPYNKRDEYLAPPFSNADNFSVTGEGVSGGFRLFNRRAGQFHPPKTKSSTNIYQVSGDFHLGADVGLGGNIGIGHHTLSVGEWSGSGLDDYRFRKDGRGNENVFFRFNNDLGGDVTFGDNEPKQALIVVSGGWPSWGEAPSLSPTGLPATMNSGKRSGRSSYIGYTTNGEFDSVTKVGCSGGNDGSVHYRSYTKDDATRSLRGTSTAKHQIGEFAITKTDGSHYVYGLPVLARAESNLQYGLEGLPQANLWNNYLAYKHVTLDANDDDLVVVGQEMDAPYATTYLLTQITTPDYIDRTNDGPTPDDLGGYTKFNYERTNTTNWYRWRTPYNGLLYNRNSMSDAKDDMGSVSHGEKEVFYLKSIETRTHIALFITESSRRDGFEADHNESNAAGDSTKPTGTNPQLRALTRIELRAKNADGSPGKLLTTVHLSYDYSLCKNLPNSAVISGSQTYGKLTLKRLWFEYEGAVKAKISPYVFGYEYRKTSDYASVINGRTVASDSKLSEIVGYGDGFTDVNGIYENPDYSPFNTDRWGSYQYQGEERTRRFNPWVNQTPDSKFDPAAWQLKWIKLPSGGEIQVQYEQNEYRYVQNEPVMVMANLRKSDPTDSIQADDYPFEYTLDLESVGIPSDSIDALVTLMRQRFVDGKEKLYYKFLHTLDNQTPTLGNCTSEFLSGYVTVASVTKSTVGYDHIVVRLGGDVKAVPRSIAQDFVTKNRNGILDARGNCGGFRPGLSNPDGDVKSMVRKLHQRSQHNSAGFDNSCTMINVRHSWLRIPFLAPNKGGKKGGGIRVRRLLMYDSGIESGDAALFGSEYLYEREDGSCSGVAANEPVMGREENPLVGYIGKRVEQNWYQKIVSSADRDQFEGPLGESLLPAPSVGYARVVVKSIYEGRTTPGYTVKEFNTAREYPFDLGNSEKYQDYRTKRTEILQNDDYSLLIGPGVTYTVSKLYRTQGYRFILNDMHGQIRRIASYAGNYPPAGKPELVESQEFDYFEPGESVPMMYGPDYEKDIRYEYPGKEMEVASENRLVEDVTQDASIEMDGTVGLIFIPIPLVGAFPDADFGESTLGTHVTTKVIRYPAIVKRVTVTKDGATTATENIGFNPQTGMPILTRTWDGYNGLTLEQSPSGHSGWYYQFAMPASLVYPAMGPKALYERTTLRSGIDTVIEKRFVGGVHFLNFHFSNGVDGSAVLNNFAEGDLVEIREGEVVNQQERPEALYLGIYRVGTVAGNRVELLPPYPECSYITSNPLNSAVSVRIVRSGRTNELNATVGSIATYGQAPVTNKHPLN